MTIVSVDLAEVFKGFVVGGPRNGAQVSSRTRDIEGYKFIPAVIEPPVTVAGFWLPVGHTRESYQRLAEAYSETSEGANKVRLTLTMDQAETFTAGLADILCWLSGFAAARTGTDMADDLPISRNTLRDLNIKLKNAMEGKK